MCLASTLSLVQLCLAHGPINSAPVPATSTSANVSASNIYVGPHVASGTPIVGNYGGQYRPQIHFSPPRGFMNDPNGMFRDHNGIWHLYYQYNPTENVAGNQHWGHATSQDLYHWTNQPIALFPPDKNTFVFSGSAVIDENNTSGLFPNQTNGVVAIYTLAEYREDGSPGPQTQAIAYSFDDGFSFVPYQNNPVIASNSSQFRDPKVIRYKDYWVMAVAYPFDFEIGIFTSPNLIDWTPTSNFSHYGILGLQWECPNLVRMPYIDESGSKQDEMWTLVVSINPGAPMGGSITQYYPGTFNGTHFEAVDSAARIADFGKDNYAGQFFYGLPDDEDPIFIGWASNWQYTQVVPTGEEGWRSAMTTPRRSYLTKSERVGWKLVSELFDISPVLGGELAANDSSGNVTLAVDFSHVESNAIYWEVNITGIPETGVSDMATANFTLLSPVSGEYVRGGVYIGSDSPFFLDRGGARGFDNVFYTDKYSFSSLVQDRSWSMSGVFDRSLLEVFLNRGVDSATSTLFSTVPLTMMVFGTADMPAGVRVSVRVHSLESAWKRMEDAHDGLVHGNQSAKDVGSQSMAHLSWQM